ncbi:metallophosphoesterase [Clostridium tarantellae]|uniref:Phosphoesterase n=1 Tax=Clostridium tarantellae TaxID=39493 RepID=A0A6I1MNE1_9CLOT|nr:metallophosphoesterase [Clostridium tarantellae]MPQ44925.1 YfcE family phosphodiesterase [Clostridium tarantellae]
MIIAVVSDTHNITNVMKKIKTLIKDADILIHLGDNIIDLEYLSCGFNGEVYGVRGNCDYPNEGAIEQIIEVNNKKIFMTHGDKYSVKMGLSTIFYKGKELQVDIVLFGHTHQKVNIEKEGMLLLNPGSPSLPKDEAASIAFLEIGEKGIKSYYKDI